MFPIELATRVIKLYSDENDIVLDPFLGSGTTALAAIKTNRRYIGIEKEQKYVDLSRASIAQAERSAKERQQELPLWIA